MNSIIRVATRFGPLRDRVLMARPILYNHVTVNNNRSIHSMSSVNSIELLHNKSCYKISQQAKHFGSGGGQPHDHGQQASLAEMIEREIQDESNQLNSQLSSDQFPGFSTETNDADVKLTKQINDAIVTVRFTVSSSLTECPKDGAAQQGQGEGNFEEVISLVSMPDFQIQITKGSRTLELSCYFQDTMEEEGMEPSENYSGSDPVFMIDELVMYEGEPKETEFAISADYLQDDLQGALLRYIADYGINDEFAKTLVEFSTAYEKKQYISMMKRLKNFVSS